MLRLIAVVSMIADHAALLLIGYGVMSRLPVGSDAYERWNAIYTGLRALGRMAFPIFAWLIAEGYARTRSWPKYAARLALLALVSELPFDWVAFGRWGMSWESQNTVFTLLLGLLAMGEADALWQIWRCRNQRENPDPDRVRYSDGARYSDGVRYPDAGRYPEADGYPNLSRNLNPGSYQDESRYWYGIAVAAAVVACVAAWLIRADYGGEGVFLIVLLSHIRGNRWRQCATGFLWSAMMWGITLSPVYLLGYAAAFLLLYGLGEDNAGSAAVRPLPRRSTVARWAAYLVYPVHLLILWGIYCLMPIG